MNWQAQGEGGIKTIYYYNPLETQTFDNSTLNHLPMFGGAHLGWQHKPVDFVYINYDCPHEEHLETKSWSGIGILVGISLGLMLFTLVLCYFSFKKWNQLEIHALIGPVVRSWRDTAV